MESTDCNIVPCTCIGRSWNNVPGNAYYVQYVPGYVMPSSVFTDYRLLFALGGTGSSLVPPTSRRLRSSVVKPWQLFLLLAALVA